MLIRKHHNKAKAADRMKKSVSFFIDINFPLGMSNEIYIIQKTNPRIKR